MAISLRVVVSTPNLTNTFSSPILHALYRKFPFSISLSSSHYLSDPKTLISLSLQHRRFLSPYHSRRRGFAEIPRMEPSLFATTTSNSSPSAPEAVESATPASPLISGPPSLSVSSLSPPFLPKPPEVSAEEVAPSSLHPGSEYAIDSDAALDLPSKPTKIAIIGGGYIAVEFAGIFNGLTSEVHIFIRQKKVLRVFDEEIRDVVGEQMSIRGIEFHTEESPQAINKSADGSLSLKTNKRTVEGFSPVILATGRRPNTKNLGLETVGVKMSKNGAIEVDEYSRTSVPSIWAVGDVTDRLNLTPVALMEGMALAKMLFKNEPTKPDYRTVLFAVFSQPPIGQVGITEEQAIQEYGDVDIFTANFKPLKATLSELPDRIFMKLIACAKTSKVLGLHLCGEDSPEIVQGFSVALKAGLTKVDFDATVGIHPTAAEELVTMRTPTRKIRKTSEGKTDLEAKAAAGV